MITLTLSLPKKIEQELEKDLKYLEQTTKKKASRISYQRGVN